MGGFALVAITFFVIWFVGKIMAEKPGDSEKQDPWHRFKRRFKGGRVYFLFAARTKERMFGELFVLYLMGVGAFLAAIDVSLGELTPIQKLDQMVVVRGTLVSLTLSKNDCRHKVAIQMPQGTKTFDICLGEPSDRREHLKKAIGKPVEAWVADEGTVLDQYTMVKQLVSQGVLLVDYAQTNQKEIARGTFIYFVLIPFLVSGLCFWLVAIMNIRKFGTKPPQDKEN
ncbi:MAG: hypothetical protein V4443_09860 [Pseudomonadota bacterium]